MFCAKEIGEPWKLVFVNISTLSNSQFFSLSGFFHETDVLQIASHHDHFITWFFFHIPQQKDKKKRCDRLTYGETDVDKIKILPIFFFFLNVVKWACLEFLKLSYISWQLQDFLAMSIVSCKCNFFIRRNKIFRNKVSKVSFGYSTNKFPLMGTENFFLGPTLVTRCCSLRFFFFFTSDQEGLREWAWYPSTIKISVVILLTVCHTILIK